MDPEVKREIIMDNYLNPKNKIKIEDNSYDKVNSNNESCIDNIDIFVKVTDGIIEDIKFDGEACAISTSSTSIMINNLIGLSISEAIKYIDNFDNMVNEKEYNRELLNEAIVYEDIYKQNNRKHCALLPYIGIRKVLEKYSK
ncbi:MAG: SUF system NifU family Fe-S cluster assembly protein [Bacilli bacterium]|nr:SUF system NifU family Fe-S cluster assembly protein [Bacilli bacterium]